MGRRIGGMGLVNYKDHPKDNRYKVFNFNSIEEADYFEDLLKKDKIDFERAEEEVESLSTIHFTLKHEVDKKGIMYLFAVPQNDLKKAFKANYLVTAKYREFSIKNSLLRYSLIIFFLAIVAFAAVGYIKSNY